MAADDFTPEELDAIELYCAGDRDFFVTYRASCLTLFVDDLSQGERAVQTADLPTLRRVAHSLKGVLTSIGQPDLAQLAARAEGEVDRGDAAAAVEAWTRLHAQMRQSLSLPASDGA